MPKTILKGGEPFYYDRGPVACLLVHGWSSTPQEIKYLGEYLGLKDITVSAPLLVGHGTEPIDLKDVKWQQWLNQIEREYLKLQASKKKVFLIGSCIGSDLVLHLAAKYRPAGVVAMATALYLHFDFGLRVLVNTAEFFGKKFFKKRGWGVERELIANKVHYWRYPPKSIKEALRCIKSTRLILPQVTAPILVMQSDTDKVLNNKNARRLYHQVASNKRELFWVPDSYHIFLLDKNRPIVLKKIYQFIKYISNENKL